MEARDMSGMVLIALLLASLLAPSWAEANILCKWLGQCWYESPGFRITVVDKETGQPLSDVHALAEWISYGMWGQKGPLMVQEAVSGVNGVLAFPTWGPTRGSRQGLVINTDPGITLFKARYKPLQIYNAIPLGVHETDRIRGFYENGQTFALEPFRGNVKERVEELQEAAYGVKSRTGLSDDERKKFGVYYINRINHVKAEAETLLNDRKEAKDFLVSLGQSIKFLQGDNPQ